MRLINITHIRRILYDCLCVYYSRILINSNIRNQYHTAAAIRDSEGHA